MTKKLAIRLAIVGMLVAGGIYAISQAQRKPGGDVADGPQAPPPTKKSDKPRKDAPNPIKTKKRPVGNPPLPPPETVRGQEEVDTNSQDPYGAASYSVADESSQSSGQPAASGEYGDSGYGGDRYGGDRYGGASYAADDSSAANSSTSGKSGYTTEYAATDGENSNADRYGYAAATGNAYSLDDSDVAPASAEQDASKQNAAQDGADTSGSSVTIGDDAPPAQPSAQRTVDETGTPPQLVVDGAANSGGTYQQPTASTDTYADPQNGEGHTTQYGTRQTTGGEPNGPSAYGDTSNYGSDQYEDTTSSAGQATGDNGSTGDYGATGNYGSTGDYGSTGGYGASGNENDAGDRVSINGGADDEPAANGYSAPGDGAVSGGPTDSSGYGSDNGYRADDETPRTIVNSAEQNARPMPLVGSNVRLQGDTPAGVTSSVNVGEGQRGEIEAAANLQQWMGIQAPALAVQKFAPREVQVNRPAQFEIRVRNEGDSSVANVVVTDRVPEGTKFLSAKPQPQAVNGQLIWQLGKMEPGDEARVVIQLLPIAEGEITSAAQVTFSAVAAAATRSTRPALSLEVAARESVLIEDKLEVTITIANQGTGPALNVVLEGDVPKQLSHPLGAALKNPLGTIEAGEQRTIKLELDAVEPGVAVGQIRLKDDVGMDLAKPVQVEVVAPQLQVGAKGPRVKYLEREAQYEIFVANPGTAAAHEIDLVATLPQGMKYVSSDKHGQYDPRTHAVYWGLQELPSQGTGTVKLALLPVDEGKQTLGIEARGDLNTRANSTFEVNVASVPELFFTISDNVDPVEVGSDTVYNIELTNQGTRADTNVVVEVILPEQLRPVAAEPSNQVQVQGQRVTFQPIAQLTPGQKLRFQVQATGAAGGDVRAAVRVKSDSTGWITKEEGTMVYGQ